MTWSKPPQLEGIAAQIYADVMLTIRRAAANDPRSLQTELGPSEIGSPCTRRIGYGLLAWPPSNPDTDPWASIIGKAVHTWLADTYGAENRRLGRERYLTEHVIEIPGVVPPIKGHSDLYDRDIATVIDWKVPGLTQIKKYRKDGPGQQYRVQAHIYGLGRQLAGETPKYVANVYLPRGAMLSDAYVWAEPYDPQVAVDAIERYQAVFSALVALDVEASPDRWQLLAAAESYCTYCPWFLPGSTDLSVGCPGGIETSAAESAVDRMIA